MPTLSWNEIKDRALKFSKDWQGESRERAEKDTFWNEFFHVFGIHRRRVATFEKPVKKLNDHYGFIDLFWKGKLLIEHKSKGQDLEKAYSQALDYFHGLKEHELPKYVLISDFQRFKLYNLDEGTEHSFEITDFIDHIQLFGFIAGWEQRTIREEDPVNIAAAELMGQLHDRLEAIGYTGHDLEVYLVRLLFCLFADDTGIFERGIFEDYIRDRTHEDGSDLSYHIAQIFQTLDTPIDRRLRTLDESMNAFPYVNGQLFAESVRIASFDSHMRDMLLQACSLDWGAISPAIFGSMFQAAMNPQERRNLGAHYTSEKNILKVIQPLFLDELHDRFDRAKRSTRQLQELHEYIASLAFLDPACGSGNFLIITYRELRRLELDILRVLRKDGQMILDVRELLKVSINHFYGIEYEEFASKVAEVGMWLVEHQMNEMASLEFGQNIINLPLQDSANIRHANALRVDWQEIVPKDNLNYIIGNPPFYGSKLQSKEQREDVNIVFGSSVKDVSIMDYVSAWYIRAAQYIQDTTIEVGFVSTNSITQGEQVSVLWHEMINKYTIKIHLCHRTFKWSNDAKNNAAVYCVIIGFSSSDKSPKRIFDYENVKADPTEIIAKNINPYLVDAPDVVISKRTRPICNVPKMSFGNMPLDGGHLILSDSEKIELCNSSPELVQFIKPMISAREFLNGINRWCIWLDGVSPKNIKEHPELIRRIALVKQFRLSSVAPSTQKHASTPSLFRDRNNPDSFIVIPLHSSERRQYIPIGIFSKEFIANNSTSIIPYGGIFHFGVLTSLMHMSWVKYTCGRIKSDYRYSKNIVYNNYPWPKDPSDKNKQNVEQCAQRILDVRVQYPDSSLADLYDPLTMPPDLVKAHQQLDRAVDLCYRPQPFTSERSRIEYLFELYEQYTAPLLAGESKKKKKKG